MFYTTQLCTANQTLSTAPYPVHPIMQSFPPVTLYNPSFPALRILLIADGGIDCFLLLAGEWQL